MIKMWLGHEKSHKTEGNSSIEKEVWVKSFPVVEGGDIA
jgi:hypothetical protein